MPAIRRRIKLQCILCLGRLPGRTKYPPFAKQHAPREINNRKPMVGKHNTSEDRTTRPYSDAPVTEPSTAKRFGILSLLIAFIVVCVLLIVLVPSLRRMLQTAQLPPQLRMPDAPATAREITPFLSTTRNMTMRDVVSRCGLPDEHQGSGIYIFIYHLNDGSTVAIGTGDLNRLLYVQHINSSNETVDLLASAGDTPAIDPPDDSGATPESSQEQPIEARFVADVKWIKVIGKRKATVVAIGPDPRWLVAIDIVSLEKPATPFTQKGRMILAIHSPVKLFAVEGKEAVGKVYTFTLSGVMREGRPSYRYAETKMNPPSVEK